MVVVVVCCCNRKCLRQKRETGLVLSDMFIIFFRKVQEIVDEGVFMCAYVWVRKGPNQRHLFIANDTDPRGKNTISPRGCSVHKENYIIRLLGLKNFFFHSGTSLKRTKF